MPVEYWYGVLTSGPIFLTVCVLMVRWYVREAQQARREVAAVSGKVTAVQERVGELSRAFEDFAEQVMEQMPTDELRGVVLGCLPSWSTTLRRHIRRHEQSGE